MMDGECSLVMNNIFDLVSDFYTQDEEWNLVLRQQYVEDFLRMKVWQGTDKGKLLQIWDHITILCVYLANAEKFLGDLNREDFIDCVGWCGRNVSDFVISADNITVFLDNLAELYQHLKKKRIITNADAALAAKTKLIVDNKVCMLDEDGNFLPQYVRYNVYSTQDLPAKIFLNIGEKLQNLMDSLQTFFAEKKYKRDIERATFLYGSTILTAVAEDSPGTEGYNHCFWDYFLFDYHMIANDKIPLQHFFDDICGNSFSEKGRSSRDVLMELLQAELVPFIVEEKNEDGFYQCRNILNNEQYILTLPIEDDVDTKDFVFLGHIFYNKSMVMNFVRGMLMPLSVRRRFVEVLGKLKDWFAVRYGKSISWETFIKRNPVLIRQLAMLYAATTRFEGFKYTSDLLKGNYKPQSVCDDKVSLTIKEMLKPYSFSKYDLFLVRTMWADYLKASGKKIEDFRVCDIWAAGIIKAFVDLNHVYNYSDGQLAEICRNVPVEVMKNTANAIKNQLSIQLHDPRYVNEEGMLLMMLF